MISLVVEVTCELLHHFLFQNDSQSNSASSDVEACFIIQFQKIFKIEEDFDIDVLPDARTHCVISGKRKILETLCCAKSYCDQWRKRKKIL